MTEWLTDGLAHWLIDWTKEFHTTQLCVCEANIYSANKDIPHISWNLEVHHHLHNSPPLGHILSQTEPVLALPLYFFKTDVNTALLTTARTSKQFFPSHFPTKTQHAILFSLI